MRFIFKFQPILLVIAVALISCTGRTSPVEPTSQNDLTSVAKHATVQSQTHLWGYYDVYIDIATGEVTGTLDRNAMFTANVVNFLNGKPNSLGFHINDTPVTADYVDVDIDVSITHPFPGLPQYNGYDVRGIFMGDGSAVLAYNPDLIYPVTGVDQSMLPDPDDGFGGPDGYTRWFNKTEFSGGGMPLMQYTQGKMASAGFNGTATLCPYKYYADGLGKNDEVFDWLGNNASSHSVFSTGVTNTRNYYLRFPNGKGIKYGYAVIANWSGADPQNHPSNAPEAVAVKVQDNSTVYYNDPSNKGGDLNLNISVWDWDSVVSAGVMDDYKILVESNVLSTPHAFTSSEMTPTAGGSYFSTFHAVIPADNIAGDSENFYWVIAECSDKDYTNPLGVTNLADADKLAAFFRYDLHVGTQGNTPPVINSITDDIAPDGLNTTVSASDTAVTYSVDYTDPDLGQDHTITWYIEDGTASAPSDPPDTMPFNWGSKAPGAYKIWVKVDDGSGPVTGGPFNITRTSPGWARTWGGYSSWDEGWDLAFDDSGNVYVSGMFSGTNVDFDPGTGIDYHNASGTFDCFVSKFSPTGDFIWAKTWGGTNEDWAKSVSISGNYLYVSGYFRTTIGSEQVDFDPDPAKTTNKLSNGDRDGFISQFNLDGTFNWVQTWGTANYEWGGEDLASDSSGNVYSLGWNETPWRIDLRSYTSAGVEQWKYIFPTSGSVGVVRMEGITLKGTNLYFTGLMAGSGMDMDPSADSYIINTGPGDGILCCFTTAGVFQYVKNWGPTISGEMWAQSITTDPSGNIYIGGTFTGTDVDFNPGAGVENHSSLGPDRDAFLTKFDSSGNHQWAKTWGSVNNEDWTKGVTSDTAGNVYAVGYYRNGSINLDPDGYDVRTNAGYIDIFLSKFDSTGDYIWGRNLGGASFDIGAEVGYNGGSLYFTGSFQSYNMDFDPGAGTDPHSPVGGEDIFLEKISTDGTW
jgi:hypothetical protein